MSKSFQKQVTRTSNALKNTILATLFFSVSTVSVNAFADTSLSIEPYKATYTAYKWGDDVGQATIELSQLGEEKYSLIYTSKVSKFFLSDKRSEHSIFLIQGDDIVPSEYYYSRSGTGPDKSLKVSFSHQGNGKITVNDGDAFKWEGEFDNQIYRLDLAKQLARGETSLTYDFINYRGQHRHYGVEVVINEMLSLPYGNVETVKVKLIRDSNKRETFAWFAPSLDYALVRLQQFKDGEEQGDIKLKAFEML